MATYTNSPLVCYTKLSPNYNKRTRPITKITIHHMAGNLTVEKCGSVFSTKSRKASTNYGVGSDGRIGMYVEEKNRSWASSNSTNDDMAVTMEIANCTGSPTWEVSPQAYASMINLCVDICQRNGIKQLVYDGTKNGTLTRHNMFKATLCPGPYLQARFPQICAEINQRLAAGTPVTPTPPSVIDPATNSNTGKFVYGNLDYSLVFDPVFYANKYADLKNAFGTNSKKLFNHFINHGMSEARQAKATFNVQVYEATYPDLQQVFGVPSGVDKKWIPYYQHYIMFGYAENRKAI